MQHCANKTGFGVEVETLEQVFKEMDADGNGEISQEEFVNFMFRAYKNYEDNLEFL